MQVSIGWGDVTQQRFKQWSEFRNSFAKTTSLRFLDIDILAALKMHLLQRHSLSPTGITGYHLWVCSESETDGRRALQRERTFKKDLRVSRSNPLQQTLETNGSIGLRDLLNKAEKSNFGLASPATDFFFWQTVSSQAQFPLTSPQWENSCLLSSIKQEKNLPGDRGVRREVPASPSRSLSPSLSFSIHLFKLAKKKQQLWDRGCQTTLYSFLFPHFKVCVFSQRKQICTLSVPKVLFIVVYNNVWNEYMW